MASPPQKYNQPVLEQGLLVVIILGCPIYCDDLRLIHFDGLPRRVSVVRLPFVNKHHSFAAADDEE